MHGNKVWDGYTLLQNYRNFEIIDGESMDFEWNIFRSFNTLQLSEAVKRLLLRLDETPDNFTGRIIFMSMFNDIPIDQKTMKKNAWRMPNSFLCMQQDLEKKNGHSLVLVLKRSGTVSVKSTRSIGQYGGKVVVGIRRKWLSNFPRCLLWNFGI